MNDEQPNRSLQAGPNPSQVDNANPSTPGPPRCLIDAAMLLCAGIQLVGAIFVCVLYLQESGSGEYQLASFRVAHQAPEEPGRTISAAWSVAQFETWAPFVWLIGSAALILAAGSAMPARRSQWYRAYAVAWILCVLAVLSAMLTLDNAQLSYRWLAGQPPVAADSWKMFVFEPSWLWQIPVLFLIANPAIILLGWRIVGKLGRGRTW